MKKRKLPPRPPFSLPLAWGVGLLLFCVTFVVFAPSARFGFVNFDDPAYTFEQPQVVGGLSLANIQWAFTHVHSGNWHPLTSISHMLDCQLFGLNPGAFHLENCLWHALATALLFLFLLRATSSIWCSAFAAALFALHPLRVESVVWIAERKDVLSAFFFMLTLLAYQRYTRQPTRAHFTLVGLWFALGLVAKPMLVTVPLILLLLDFWPFRRREALKKLFLEKLPLFGLAALASFAALIAQHAALSNLAELPLAFRLGNALTSYFVNLRQFFWPHDLAFFYPYPETAQVGLAVAAACGLFLVSFVLWRVAPQFPWVAVGGAWFLVMLLPVIGVIHVGKQGHADRYTYLPSIGLGIALAGTLASFRWKRPLVAVFGTTILVVLLALTLRQERYWRDPETLWRHTLAVTDRNFIAHSYLADLLLRQNRVADSLAEGQTALQLQPDDPDAMNNTALALFRSGRPAEAARLWEQSLARKPDDLNIQSNYAWLLATCPERALRNGPRAVELTQNVLRHGGDQNPFVLRAAGAALAESGRFAEAGEFATRARVLAEGQGNAALVHDLEMNLRNYRAGLPLRDSGLMP